MCQFIIELIGTTENRVFTTNLSTKNSNMFLHWGTNIKGCNVTANSVSVSKRSDYNFILNAFSSLAKIDGNANNITDTDFKGIKKSSMGCGNQKVKTNIWHSDEPREYNYHEGGVGSDVGRTIWLTDHSDDGV